MVKHQSGVFIAHAVERHGAVDVRVVAADDVARGHVDDVLALVGQEALYRAAVEADRRPSGEEDSILDHD